MVREWSIERDDRLLRELYPDTARKILPYIEEECDRLEYNGSRMYDEFPDKYMCRKLNDRIYERVCKEAKESGQTGSEAYSGRKEEELYADDEIFATSFLPPKGQERDDRYLKELIDVLMYHEMFSRRCRHNQCKCCRRQ